MFFFGTLTLLVLKICLDSNVMSTMPSPAILHLITFSGSKYCFHYSWSKFMYIYGYFKFQASNLLPFLKDKFFKTPVYS